MLGALHGRVRANPEPACAAAQQQPRCQVNLRYGGSNQASYPDRALSDGAIAGVAVRYRINEAGQVTEARTVAIIGREEFARAVNNSTRCWLVDRVPDSPANCRMAMTIIRSIVFTIG